MLVRVEERMDGSGSWTVEALQDQPDRRYLWEYTDPATAETEAHAKAATIYAQFPADDLWHWEIERIDTNWLTGQPL